MRLFFYKIFFLSIILITLIFDSKSQESRIINNTNIESKLYYGAILKHRSSLGYYIKDHVPALEINYNIHTQGNKIYHQVFRFPTVGFGYYFSDLGNPQVLGNAHVIFSFINIPIIKTNKLSFNYKISYGFSYLTKCFDIENNYYNTAIGSKANVYINLGLNFRIRITKRLVFTNGISIAHFSNGALKVPNLGINVVSYDIGLQYKLNNYFNKTNKMQLPVFNKRNEYSIIFSNGIKEIQPPAEKKYYVFDFCFNAERIINYKRKLGAGIDIFYDNSIYQQFKNDSINATYKDILRFGFHLSNDLVFNKISMTIQQGVYFYQKYLKDGYFYSRYGLKYSVSNRIFVCFTLKTHLFKADFMELGIGCLIK